MGRGRELNGSCLEAGVTGGRIHQRLSVLSSWLHHETVRNRADETADKLLTSDNRAANPTSVLSVVGIDIPENGKIQ